MTKKLPPDKKVMSKIRVMVRFALLNSFLGAMGCGA